MSVISPHLKFSNFNKYLNKEQGGFNSLRTLKINSILSPFKNSSFLNAYENLDEESPVMKLNKTAQVLIVDDIPMNIIALCA